MNRTLLLSLFVALPLTASAQNASAPAPKTLRVAAVQMRSTRDLDANVKRLGELLQQCAKQGVQVAVFPECALTGYFNDAILQTTASRLADAEQALCASCAKFGVAAVVGSPWREGDKLFNSALVIDETGKVVERYHKIQLAENWPVGGDHMSVFKIRGVPCSVIVCHDERYPELVRVPVLAGARVVFYTSHESGLKFESKIDPYRAQIQARAVENGVFIVQANAPANSDTTGSHGHSRLILPDGNILKEASMFGEDMLTAELNLKQATAHNALNSLNRGLLGKWYAEAVKQVRIIP